MKSNNINYYVFVCMAQSKNKGANKRLFNKLKKGEMLLIYRNLTLVILTYTKLNLKMSHW